MEKTGKLLSEGGLSERRRSWQEVVVCEYDYFYGPQADQFSFIRIPTVLFSAEQFKNVSPEAKVLYGILLKRMDLSAKNGWFDDRGRVYIICTLEEIMETMRGKVQNFRLDRIYRSPDLLSDEPIIPAPRGFSLFSLITVVQIGSFWYLPVFSLDNDRQNMRGSSPRFRKAFPRP